LKHLLAKWSIYYWRNAIHTALLISFVTSLKH